ncbi:MAG: hypothetical protein JW818_15980 [Pirellulales bacterium]|nr:hypothetical protein [Pirellulales bacterium]
MEVAGVFFLFIVIAVVFRLLAGSIDTGRIESYVQQRGWTLLDKSWDPFGPGWFGEKDSRIYQIVYRDTQGDIRRAHVKTSMFSGVYLTNDQVVQRAQHTPADDSRTAGDLREENERLRQRIEELERKNRVG